MNDNEFDRPDWAEPRDRKPAREPKPALFVIGLLFIALALITFFSAKMDLQGMTLTKAEIVAVHNGKDDTVKVHSSAVDRHYDRKRQGASFSPKDYSYTVLRFEAGGESHSVTLPYRHFLLHEGMSLTIG